MIKHLIYRLLERRHYWRYVSFSEIAELYASRTLRTLAVSMVSIFVGIYLYQNGYGLTFIMLYFAAYYVLRTFLSWPTAYCIARIGPKHATLLSNFLYVPSLLLFVMVPGYGILALIGAGFFQALSVTLYDMAYLVDFSKVRHNFHAGKEISYMHMLDQIAKGLSPVIGGFIAYWFNPQALLFTASVVFAVAAIPLFFTPEPVKTHQHITYHGVAWRKIYKAMIAQFATGIDFIASSVMWSLLIAIAIFSIGSNVVYAQLGVLSSVTVLAGVVSAKLFGRLIDKRAGGLLLQTGVSANALAHLLRVFVATPLGVLLVNIANEIATAAYTLPYTKGLFDLVDELPGYRIVVMSLMSGMAALGAAFFSLVMAGLSMVFEEVQSLQVGYIISAFFVLLIMRHGFPGLKRRRLIG